jgi:signal transduction histidine kinase
MVQDTRQEIAGLRAAVLANQGLVGAIRLELEALLSAGWDVQFEEQLGEERLPEAVETTLFRVAQEALTNARKHAHTNRLRVSLWRDARVICLEIRDWGRGFSPAEMRSSSGPHERIGLAGIQERIGWLQGRCIVCSEPGKGTLIVAEVPLCVARPV